MATHDRSRSQTMRHSTNPPAPAHPQADLSPMQALGNQVMQTKLEVNAPNDSYEQEADSFASQVTNAAPAQRAAKEPEKKKDDKAAQKKPLAAQATPLIQRAGKSDDKKKADAGGAKGGKEADKKKDDKAAQKMPVQRADDKKKDDKAAPKAGKADEKKKDDKAAQKMPIQRADKADQEGAQSTGRQHGAQLDDDSEKKKDDKAAQTMAVQRAAEAGTTTADPRVEQDVERQKQGGRPLSSGERQYFEPRFGADFSSVRVHDDAEAARAASDLNAKAFTQGSHIFFGSGYHQPSDTPGRQLMAHELTHTLQQGAAQPAAPTPAAHAPAAPAQRQAQAPTQPPTQAAPVEAAPTGLIQRQTSTTPPPGGGSTGSSTAPGAANTDPATDATQFDESKGKIDSNDHPTTITFDKILIPSFKNSPAAAPKSNRQAKYTAQTPLRRTKAYSRGTTDQRNVWS